MRKFLIVAAFVLALLGIKYVWDVWRYKEYHRKVAEAAYETGDYAVIAATYAALARQGYTPVQTELGTMYSNGMGLPVNNVKAYMWYTIASANGDELAIESRDQLFMLPEQIIEAQALVLLCKKSDYQDCGYGY